MEDFTTSRGHMAWLCAMALAFSGCFFGGKKGEVVTPEGAAEPDKILYEKGLHDVAKGRYDVGCLVFQTLLNTYPDSEYQERAALAIADTCFKQGGTSGMHLPLEKSYRDATRARAAEEEFKAFMVEHSDSPLLGEARQQLGEVQEILAQRDLRAAKHDLLRGNLKGAFRRAEIVIENYPDFSGQDEAIYLLGQVREQQQNITAAGYYYRLVVKRYPLGEYESKARKRLEKLGLPIPNVDSRALPGAKDD